METVKFKHKYKGIGGCDCICGIEVYHNIVVCTELEGENEGTSITNWCEELANQICNKVNISPQNLIWIEHYQDRGYYNKRSKNYEYPEDWTLIQFNVIDIDLTGMKGRLVSPRFISITKDVVDALISMAININK